MSNKEAEKEEGLRVTLERPYGEVAERAESSLIGDARASPYTVADDENTCLRSRYIRRLEAGSSWPGWPSWPHTKRAQMGTRSRRCSLFAARKAAAHGNLRRGCRGGGAGTMRLQLYSIYFLKSRFLIQKEPQQDR